MSKREVIVLAVLWVCMVMACRAIAEPRVYVDVHQTRWYETGGDSIAPGQSLFGEHDTSLWINNWSTAAQNPTVSTDDTEVWWVWGGEPWPGSMSHDADAGRIAWRFDGPLEGDDWIGLGYDRFAPSWTGVSPIGVTRSFDRDVLTSDDDTVRMTVALDVAAGSLDGYDYLEVWIPSGDNWWADGVSVSIDNSAAPEYWGNGNYFSADPSGLDGTYQIEVDVRVRRTGQFAQANYGDMCFRPNVQVSFGMDGSAHSATGTQVSVPGSTVQVAVDGPPDTQFNTWLVDNKTTLEMNELYGQANGELQLHSIELIMQRVRSMAGGELSRAGVWVEANNLTSAQVATPGGQVYDMELDYDDDDDHVHADLEFVALTDALVEDEGFTNGTYVFTFVDCAGNVTQRTVDLAGGYPTAFPELVSDVITDADAPMLEWLAPPAGVDAIHAEMEGAYDEDVWPDNSMLIIDGAATSTTLSPVPALGQQASIIFFDGDVIYDGDTRVLAGYVTEAQHAVIVTPEPTSMALLGLGSLTLLRRRQKLLR